MAERQMQLEDWLDDLCVRFIINLPQDNLASVERICFQIEEAQWFYEDFIRPLDPTLPSFSLRNFSLRVFSHCPLLSAFAISGRHMQAFDEFLAYKNRIPVRGAIMLNEAMDSTVLVKGWKKGANWSFPRGKINKDEDDLICAIREVYEETGLDLEAAGLIPLDRKVKQIEINIREQQMRLYVFKNVPMDTHFEPRTRKEISKIQWWRLSDLPAFKKKNGGQEPVVNANKFYMVAPFLVPLRKWINEQRRINSQKMISVPGAMVQDGFLTEDDRGDESTVPTVYDVSAPESNGREDSGDLLSRFLKTQPSSQSSQLPLGSNTSFSQALDSGQALLALLQNKPTNQHSSEPLPKPPLEQIMGMAPIPNPHHHHHPHPPRFPEMPPAPQFAAQASTNAFIYEESNRQRLHHPQTQPIPGFLSNSTQPSHFANHHHNQSQHLIHPQPLPPNVQKVVFTGDTAQSPHLPDTVVHQTTHQHYGYQQPVQWSSQNLSNRATLDTQSMHIPPALDHVTRKEGRSQLNNHSLALLNAFKGTGSTASDPSNPSNQLNSTIQSHPQELPAELSVSTHASHKSGTTAHHAQPSAGVPTHRQAMTAQQKSALLDIFKNPSTQPVAPVNEFAATALPISSTPSAVELSAVEPLTSTSQTTDRGRLADLVNEPIPELTSESNLSFRPKKILSRPEKPDREDSLGSRHNGSVHTEKLPHPRAAISKGKAPEAGPKVFAPQILKRPQSDLPINTRASPLATSALVEVPAPVPERRGGTETSSTLASPEHKQTLLSLFGKSSQLPVILPSSNVSRTSTLEIVSAVSPTDAVARTRLGSIVSAETNSRRGSQAPLSKANESFLLGYLDAFTGTNQH